MRGGKFTALLVLAALFIAPAPAAAKDGGAFDAFISTLESWGRIAAGITGDSGPLEDISLFAKFAGYLRSLAEDLKSAPFAFIAAILRFFSSMTPFAEDGPAEAPPLPPEQTYSL